MSTLSSRHGWKIFRSDANACTCTPENPRHSSGYQCVTAAQLAAWRSAEPLAANRPHFSREEMDRCLCWLWLNFSPDPEAKRLSGRP